MRRIAVVTTTINIPKFLIQLSKNALSYKHSNLFFYIIGDKRTPKSIVGFVNKLKKQFPYTYYYLGIKDQEKRLKNKKKLLKIMPYNSGARKLLGNFIAYKDGADLVIQIDDDNFVQKSDFIGEHGNVDKRKKIKLFSSKNGWYNIYEQLNEKNNIPFFPRGFPWSKRQYLLKSKNIKVKKDIRKIVLINGLVLEDPDVDAISRLFWPVRVVSSKNNLSSNFGLYPGTWSSFNNQNTSTSREVTSVFFTPVAAGRNSDIWTSYVICKLAEISRDVIAFGAPYVKQYRNPHNLWVDLKDELPNNLLTEYFVNLLSSIKLKKSSYMNMLLILIEKSLNKIKVDKKLKKYEKNILFNYFKEYKIWALSIKN